MTRPGDPDSHDRATSSRIDALAVGQAGERQLMCTGWVGEHPQGGGDVAHLLLYPAGHGVADRMRTLATGLGLGPGDQPLRHLDREEVHAWLDDDSHVHVQGPGGEVAERPVPGAWRSAATTRGYLVLSIGMDPLVWRTGDWDALDRWLARGRHQLGLVDVVAR